MIQSYGQGQPGDLVRPILHHARDLEGYLDVMAEVSLPVPVAG